ncbi:hypothetical protein HAX54_019591, partial [Datura stramonium]|nr:hypothetical protein [Datura stramonium]
MEFEPSLFLVVRCSKFSSHDNGSTVAKNGLLQRKMRLVKGKNGWSFLVHSQNFFIFYAYPLNSSADSLDFS